MHTNSIISKNIIRLSFLYILVPFIIFCIGFLNILYSIPLSILLAYIFFRIWQNTKNNDLVTFTKRGLIIVIIIVFLWVFLSGIGGFAFQNSDFNGRNAIFRDLIDHRWPVFYTRLGDSTFSASTYSMVYYFGFWLLPALIGKITNWVVANIFLYLYSSVGIILTIFLISKKIKAPLWKSALLLIFFSGMDIVGSQFHFQIYPTLWPPISHLEWWNHFQFSSSTTQLFWVFNQAIPTWICTALILNIEDNRTKIFIWSLCFFFSPITAFGLGIIIIGLFLNQIKEKSNFQKSKNIIPSILQIVKELFSFENIFGGVVCSIIIYLFICSNQAPSTFSFVTINKLNIIKIIIFTLIDWLLIWIVIGRHHRYDFLWYTTGIFFACVPFFTVSDTAVICERATIAPLFLLMIWCGETIFHQKTKTSISLILILGLGIFTPLYEINRSIYRTVEYYFGSSGDENSTKNCTESQLERLAFPKKPEEDHPGQLLADDWCSLSTLNPEYITAYVADISESFFFKYLAKK
jgi:hypothetical protein